MKLNHFAGMISLDDFEQNGILFSFKSENNQLLYPLYSIHRNNKYNACIQYNQYNHILSPITSNTIWILWFITYCGHHIMR